MDYNSEYLLNQQLEGSASDFLTAKEQELEDKQAFEEENSDE